jgi:type IV secretory pathway VirB6-like protein
MKEGNKEGSNLTLSFKIHDPEKNTSPGGVKSICDGDDCEDINVYYDNDGGYNVRVRVGRTGASTLSITKKIIEPVIEILDGKDVRISSRLCDSSTPNLISSSNLQCYRASTGESCGFTSGASDPDCYVKCDTAVDNDCQYANVKTGLLENIYKVLIQNAYYKTILNLALILFVTFYGFGFFIGLTNFTQTELIIRLFKIGFIYLLVSENGWTFTDKSVLFKGADDVITLFFSGEIQAKIWGLFFASWFGWAYVLLIFFSMLIFIVAMANALVIYLTAQIFISLLLSLAPIFILLILFGMTKSMFDKWLSSILSFALQQIFLVTTLAFFSILMKEILKFVLSYRVCWEPIWTIPLYITDIELFSFWKIAGLAEGASPNAMGNVAPSITHILFIFLIAATLQKFLGFMVNLATNISGGISASSLAGGVTGAIGGLRDRAVGIAKGQAMKRVVGPAKRAVLGTSTLEERNKARQAEQIKQDQASVIKDQARKDVRGATDDKISQKIANLTETDEDGNIIRRPSIEEVEKSMFNDAIEARAGELGIADKDIAKFKAGTSLEEKEAFKKRGWTTKQVAKVLPGVGVERSESEEEARSELHGRIHGLLPEDTASEKAAQELRQEGYEANANPLYEGDKIPAEAKLQKPSAPPKEALEEGVEPPQELEKGPEEAKEEKRKRLAEQLAKEAPEDKEEVKEVLPRTDLSEGEEKNVVKRPGTPLPPKEEKTPDIEEAIEDKGE